MSDDSPTVELRDGFEVPADDLIDAIEQARTDGDIIEGGYGESGDIIVIGDDYSDSDALIHDSEAEKSRFKITSDLYERAQDAIPPTIELDGLELPAHDVIDAVEDATNEDTSNAGAGVSGDVVALTDGDADSFVYLGKRGQFRRTSRKPAIGWIDLAEEALDE